MKRIVSLVLAISMVMSMFVSSFAATYTDVPGEDGKNATYAASVDALSQLGVLNGFDDGTFGPDKTLTRAQVAKMLVICLGLGEQVDDLKGRALFTDVSDASSWYAGYVNAAAQNKIIVGYPDGTFLPEKEVTYAELYTMVLRALGYGNVVDAEGSWPTAYLSKAVELRLNKDVEGSALSGNATRGNTAVIVWNMLRTRMWRIGEENETNGMTSSTGNYMLNIKFPDYEYHDDVTVSRVAVLDDEAYVTLSDGAKAQVKDTDLTKILVGMKVDALEKDVDDEDKDAFISLTARETIVSGVITSAVKDGASKIEVDGKNYSLKDADTYGLKLNDYVVFEADGAKVDTDAEIRVLPTDATEVVKLETMKNKIDEDALVIIDGEWATRDDIEVDDVYTKIDLATLDITDGDDATGEFYMVARDRVTGAFESLTKEYDGDEVASVTVDGKDYTAILDNLDGHIFEGEDNDDDVEIDALMKKASDNKYLENDVELVLNYLGQVARMNFGKVNSLDGDGDFYAVVSNGIWSESTSTGSVKHILLVGMDGEEREADTIASGVEIPEALEEDAVWADKAETVVPFVYVVFNSKDEIKEIKVLNASGLVEDSGETTATAFTAKMDSDNKIADHKVTAATTVLVAKPVIEDKGETTERVTGVEVTVEEGIDAAKGYEAGFIVYDATTVAERVQYVLVSDDAESDYMFGTLDSVKTSNGVVIATISGKEYNVSDDSLSYSAIKGLQDRVVIFTESDDEITFEDVTLSYKDVDDSDAVIVTKVDTDGDDKAYAFSKAILATAGTTLDMSDEDAIDLYDDVKFVVVNVSESEDNEVEFDSVEDAVEGVEDVTFHKYDRIVVTKVNGDVVAFVLTSFQSSDKLADGVFTNDTTEATEAEEEVAESGEEAEEEVAESGEEAEEEAAESGDEAEEEAAESGDEAEESGDEAEEVSGDEEVSGEASGDAE